MIEVCVDLESYAGDPAEAHAARVEFSRRTYLRTVWPGKICDYQCDWAALDFIFSSGRAGNHRMRRKNGELAVKFGRD